MVLFDLPLDVIELIKDELYRLRKKNCMGEFKNEWIDRRPHYKLVTSGRETVHVGRSFLTTDLKKVSLINIPTKYYIGGELLSTYMKYGYDPNYRDTCGGMEILGKSRKKYEKMLNFCEDCGWTDYPKSRYQNWDILLNYLIKKE
jgi:hypothetical protein